MPIVCVDGAAVKITVNGPQQIQKTTDTIPSATKNELSVNGKPVLLEEDIRIWLSSYQTSYDNMAFKGGMATGSAITVPATVTVKGISIAGLVTKDTVVGCILQVGPPAINPQGVPDPVPIINITVEFTDPTQDLLTAI